ncbi:hypothetical protein ACU5AX_03405 [Sphingomonas sp. XXL09]|uniref:hypothetical protein n=1 Tax=Sphingomonas sp. XXL09 TaxID=3457787 RepID=UPI00406BD7E2
MSDEQGNLILEILKRMQGDLASVKRDVASQAVRISALEDYVRGMTTSLFGLQADVTAINHRLDRIERRLDLTEEA